MKKRELKKIGRQIARLERKCQENQDNSSAYAEMDKLIQNLSFAEMLYLDTFIQKLLTK